MYKKINNFYRFYNRSDFIQFVNDTKEDFDCKESWEYNFGFQLNWDEDTGEILETLDEWLQDKNNRMKYEPESYPCTCYYLNETRPDRFGDAKCFIFDYVEDKEFSCNNEKEVDEIRMVTAMNEKYDPDCEAVYDKGYKDGLEKAWEVAKRIFTAYEKAYKRHELEIIFGEDITAFKFTKMTVFEIVDKVELYEKQKVEKDKIKDGDEVILDDGTKGVVVYNDTDGHLNVVNAYGGMRSYNATQVIKTGRHFPQMVELMKEMRDNDENDKHR